MSGFHRPEQELTPVRDAAPVPHDPHSQTPINRGKFKRVERGKSTAK